MLYIKMGKHENYNSYQNAETIEKTKTQEHKINTDKTSDNTFEILKENYVKQIQNLASLLYNTKDWLFNAAYYTWLPKECSDWSNLYTIIKINWKDLLIKIWAWEFNTEVFNQKNINKVDKFKKNEYPQKDYKILKWFSRTPIPLFVVHQQDSYFANDTQKRLQNINPKQYLQENGIIIVPKKKQAYLKWNNDNINFNNINILQSNIAIKKLQTAIFESKFSKKELIDVKKFIQRQKSKDYNKFESTITYFKKNNDNKLFEKIIFILENMVEEKWNTKQIYDLINTYNTNKNQFE